MKGTDMNIIKKRISSAQQYIEKAKQIIGYIGNVLRNYKVVEQLEGAEFVDRVNYLLYLIDLDYYELYEEQLMGLTYTKRDTDVVSYVAEAILNNNEINFESPQFIILDHEEISFVNLVMFQHYDKTNDELRMFIQKDIPWLAAKIGEAIKYNGVFYRNDDTSVRKYTKEEEEEED